MSSETRTSLLDALLEKTSRTFALSIPVLPEPTRVEVTVAYLLFRIADTLEDATLWSRSRQVDELAAMAALLREPTPDAAAEISRRWTADPPLDHDGYLELLGETPEVIRATVELSPAARKLVCDHTLRTIDLMADFVSRRDERDGLELRNTQELRDYCYAVAGIVGEMLTELFLLDRAPLQPLAPALRERAATFGEALQLVNILKDAATDATEGRRYLPAGSDRLALFGLARDDLRVAGEYVRTLQDAGAPRGIVEFTALPVLLAWATLDRVEEDGPGAKVSRGDVVRIVGELTENLDAGRPAVPADSSAS
jgi:farnesyl-diphosphate farnesyltransferase